jgi:Ni,Fe-hydrogenase III component G
MAKEENIKNSLVKKFPFLADSLRVQRQRRMFADVDYANFDKVFQCGINDFEFVILCAITGTDDGATIGVIYHIATEDGIILSLKTAVPRNAPAIKSIAGLFPAADVYERELVDLLGVEVSGLVEGNRYPLTDDWPKGEYPLRKDWKPSAGKKETKNA